VRPDRAAANSAAAAAIAARISATIVIGSFMRSVSLIAVPTAWHGALAY
jgi:hypothetical protein